MKFPLFSVPQESLSLRSRHLQKICWAAEHGSWELCRFVGANLGLLQFAARRRFYQSGTKNLRRAFPRLSESGAQRIMRRTVQNSAMAFLESLHLRTVSPCDLARYAQFERLKDLTKERANGSGILLATAHLGNNEILGARLAQEMAFTVTTLEIGSVPMEKHFAETRYRSGIDTIHPKGAARNLFNRLNNGEVVILFADQESGENSLTLPFFGVPKRTIVSPARLSEATGATVFPIFAVRRTPWLANGRFEIRLYPELMPKTSQHQSNGTRIAEKTRQFNAQLEAVLRENPDQWYGWNLL